MKKKLLTALAAFAMAATVSAQVTFTCTAGTKFGQGEGIDKLFDGNTATKYCGDSGDNVFALFTASAPVFVWGYDMTTANDNEDYGRCVGKWQLFGTDDATVGANPYASGWVALSDLGRNEMIQQKNFYTQRFFCEKGVNKRFKYFKLVLNEQKKWKDTDGTYRYYGTIQLSEFKLLAEEGYVANYKWKASSQENSWKAVDLLLSQKWEGSNLAGNWMTLETEDGLPYAVQSYSFSTHDDGSWGERAPKSWKIEGSNDNTNWTLIDQVVDDDDIQNANYTTFVYTPSNTTDKFRYIKLTLNAMKGTGWTQVGEFHVLGVAASSDAQYYTDLVNAAKATKAEYEAFMGASDSWCVDYNTFFNGLNLDAVLAAAIEANNYETLEAKLKEAKEHPIAQAINQLLNGANYAAIAGSADKCWGDGHYTQLFDGKDGLEGRTGSKWGGSNFPQYVIFRVKEAFKPYFYKLVTGNDTANNTGRNWSTWNVYGGNFATFSAATDSTTSKWTLLDSRENVSDEYLPMKNYYSATFNFNKGVSQNYMYFMVKVIAAHSGNQQQMSEMYLCTQEEFEAIRQPMVDEFQAFADALSATEVESDRAADKAAFLAKFALLKTTDDAVVLTKLYNELVPLKKILEESAAFVAGGYRIVIGNTGTFDSAEGYSKLVDGTKDTKWCGTIPTGGSYVIFKRYANDAMGQYMLTTGNDTGNSPGRNWKSWKIYGCNFKVPAGSADSLYVTRDLSNWTLIDEKTNIGQDRLPAANFAPAFFNFSEAWSGYKFFKIEVETAYNGTLMQMAEFKLLSDDEFAAIRQTYVDQLSTIGAALAAQYNSASISASLKQEIISTATAKCSAVVTATADELLPLYNDAVNYITVEAPAMIAAAQLVIVDGVYQLSTPQHLLNFASLVNNGNLDVNAVLVNDIDMNGVEWPAPIGNWANVNGTNNAYKGHFDGQGFAIKNFTYTTNQEYHGLFGVISTGALIENFSIAGTITNPNNSQLGVVGFARDNNPTIRNVKSALNINNSRLGARIGGILGVSYQGSTVNVDRCTYSGTIDGNDNQGNGNYGGIVGYTQNNATTCCRVTNCLFDGKLINTAATPGNCTFGGIVGYVGANPDIAIKNCLSIGTVQSAVTGQFFGAVKSARCSIVNSFYQGTNVNGSASSATPYILQAVEVTDEQLASGYAASKLGVAWRQVLGTDAYPVPDYVKPVVVEITDAGYATLFVPETDLTVPTGVTAYTAEYESDWLKLNAITGAIAAGEPVVLKGAEGFYNFALTTGATKVAGNVLEGKSSEYEVPGHTTSTYYYVLAKPEGEDVGFYLVQPGTTIPANKAYIVFKADGEVKAFYFLFPDDDPTGIETIDNGQLSTDDAIYNLAGQRLSKMQKGVNIVSGKKVLK